MHFDLRVKCPLLLINFNQNWKFFHENPPSESRIVLCGQTDRYDADNRCFSHLLRTRLEADKYIVILGIIKFLYFVHRPVF
jgi:hypothetical protein